MKIFKYSKPRKTGTQLTMVVEAQDFGPAETWTQRVFDDFLSEFLDVMELHDLVTNNVTLTVGEKDAEEK